MEKLSSQNVLIGSVVDLIMTGIIPRTHICSPTLRQGWINYCKTKLLTLWDMSSIAMTQFYCCSESSNLQHINI